MPDKNKLKFEIAKSAADLKNLRVPGTTKPFEQLTISELTQLRPGQAAADSYNITAVGSDITVSTSSLLAEIAQARGQEVIRQEINTQRIRGLQNIETNLPTGAITKIGG
jgi:hypothetical protein